MISNVMGFNFKADIKDINGETLPSGVKGSVLPKEPASKVNTRMLDKKFFTSYNEPLLDKIRDFKKMND